MKRLPVLTALSTLAVASQSVCADTEFVDNVPIAVVKQFIGNPLGGEGAIYSDILDAFPPFTVPPDFAVLASTDQGYIQRVILSSSLDTPAAQAALAAAFLAEGWMEIPIYGMPAQQTGFVSAEQPAAVPIQLCHDDHGAISIQVSGGADLSYVSINRNVVPTGMGMVQPGCAERLAQAQGPTPFGMRGANTLYTYVPTLVMPQPEPSSNRIPAIRDAFMMGGTGSSQNDWQTQATLASSWSIDEIYAHFATQMTAQGWTIDSEVTGAIAATGNWTKNIDDMDLVGTLSIIRMANNNWELRLRLLKQVGAQSGAVNGVIINGSRIVRSPAG